VPYPRCEINKNRAREQAILSVLKDIGRNIFINAHALKVSLAYLTISATSLKLSGSWLMVSAASLTLSDTSLIVYVALLSVYAGVNHQPTGVRG
jgi:hypothetical protein